MPGGGGSTQPAGNTVTTQTSAPWAGQVPYITHGLQRASDLFSTGGPQYFPGTTYAPATQGQTQGLQGIVDYGLNGGSPVINASTNAATNILNPNFLNSNPGNAGFNDILNGGAGMKEAIARATPGLLDTFTQGNRLNSPGAAYAVSKGIGDAAAAQELGAAGGLSSNYNAATQAQNQANFIAPNTAQLPTMPLEAAVNAGGQQQTLGQNTINDAIARYNFNQTRPFNLLNWYNGAVGGNLGGTSTLTTPYFTQPTGGFGAGLAGAAGGAGLGGSIFGPYGAAGGGILGGVLGGLGL